MREALAKLLLIAAMLLMPLGMAAPAAATAHHAQAAAMQHCPDEGGAAQDQGGIAQCMMACASALPALAPSAVQALSLDPVKNLVTGATRLADLHPDTATPPPRFA